jgi:hypothetical protein
MILGLNLYVRTHLPSVKNGRTNFCSLIHKRFTPLFIFICGRQYIYIYKLRTCVSGAHSKYQLADRDLKMFFISEFDNTQQNQEIDCSAGYLILKKIMFACETWIQKLVGYIPSSLFHDVLEGRWRACHSI